MRRQIVGHLARVDSLDVEQIVHQRQQVSGIAVRDLGHVLRHRRQHARFPVGHQRQGAEYVGQRRAQFMTDGGDKGVFQPVGFCLDGVFLSLLALPDHDRPACEQRQQEQDAISPGPIRPAQPVRSGQLHL